MRLIPTPEEIYTIEVIFDENGKTLDITVNEECILFVLHADEQDRQAVIMLSQVLAEKSKAVGEYKEIDQKGDHHLCALSEAPISGRLSWRK